MSTFPANPIEQAVRGAADGRLSVGEWLESRLTAQVWAPVTAAEGGSGTFPVLSVDGGTYVAPFLAAAAHELVRLPAVRSARRYRAAVDDNDHR